MSNALTVIKELPRPWTIAGQTVTEIELRAPTLNDLLAAEQEAHPYKQPTGFRVAMACQTMVRAGTHTGPFVRGQFKDMTTSTWAAIADALTEAEELGEGQQPGPARTS